MPYLDQNMWYLTVWSVNLKYKVSYIISWNIWPNVMAHNGDIVNTVSIRHDKYLLWSLLLQNGLSTWYWLREQGRCTTAIRFDIERSMRSIKGLDEILWFCSMKTHERHNSLDGYHVVVAHSIYIYLIPWTKGEM